MPLLTKKRLLAAAIETTPGTAETLLAANAAFNAYDLVVQPTISVEDRPAQASLGQSTGTPGTRMGTATFRTEVAWDGTATLPTWATVLLPACGYANTTGTFTPRSEAPGTNVKTLTIAQYVDGMKKQIKGAVGNWRAIMTTGQRVVIEWNFQGVWDGVTDAALLSPTHPTAPVIRYADATTTYAGDAQCVNQITFDAGNVITMIECADSVAGFKHAMITDRRPTITANPESKLVAGEDRYGDWLAASEGILTVSLPEPDGGSIAFTAPKAQIRNVQEGDREGLLIEDIEWTANKNASTNDEDLQVAFTEAV